MSLRLIAVMAVLMGMVGMVILCNSLDFQDPAPLGFVLVGGGLFVLLELILIQLIRIAEKR